FFTEASLDLAEDPELMQLMVDANIQSVFIGIESPNEESLKETKKLQNVRPVGTLVERVRRVQKAGLDVWCGMIVGFDHDDPSIFDAQRRFLREARILHAMIGMLAAIPKTPLYDRLAAEGRLDLDDESEFGTNVIPLHMTRQELRDGYLKLMRDVYDPEDYFERLDGLYVEDKFEMGRGRARWWRKHPWWRFRGLVRHIVASTVLYSRLMQKVPDAELRNEYRRRIWRVLRIRRDTGVLFVYLLKVLAHYHHYTMATRMADRESQLVNSF